MLKFEKRFLFMIIPILVLSVGLLFEGWIIVGLCLSILFIDSLLSFIFRRFKTISIYTTKTLYTNNIPKNTLWFMFGTLLINKESFTGTELNHKLLHRIQGQETGYFLMYLIYFIEYCIKLIVIGIRYKYFLVEDTNIFIKAYHSISFEQEVHEDIERNKRPNYNWTKYIFKIN